MLHRAIAALRGKLIPHLALSNSRVETMALLVIGMINARTVNLSHVASARPTGVLVASTYRRLQRFFRATWTSGATGRRRWSPGCSI